MKTKNFNLIIAIFSLVPTIAFAQLTESRKLDHFSKVHSRGFFDVELTKGNQEGAKIVATNFPLDKIITKVENGILKIEKVKTYRHRGNARVKIYVTFKSLDGLKNSGSGDLLCKSDIVANKSEFHSSGSGNLTIRANIKSGDIRVRNSGSGDIYIERIEAQNLNMDKSGSGSFKVNSGNVDTQDLSSSGSGNMLLSGLISNTCNIKISGSGHGKLNVNEYLNARISGSGGILYKGNARIDAKISGSGKVRSL